MTEEAPTTGLPPTPNRFIAYRWDDNVVAPLQFPVNSIYTETVLLPILGPSATLCLRRLGAWAEAHPNGIEIDTMDLSRDLGLGGKMGRNQAINRTLHRLCQFDMAAWSGDWLAVRTTIAPLPDRHVARLTPAIAHVHRTLVEKAGGAQTRVDVMMAGLDVSPEPIVPVAAGRVGVGL